MTFNLKLHVLCLKSMGSSHLRYEQVWFVEDRSHTSPSSYRNRLDYFYTKCPVLDPPPTYGKASSALKVHNIK